MTMPVKYLADSRKLPTPKRYKSRQPTVKRRPKIQTTMYRMSWKRTKRNRLFRLLSITKKTAKPVKIKPVSGTRSPILKTSIPKTAALKRTKVMTATKGLMKKKMYTSRRMMNTKTLRKRKASVPSRITTTAWNRRTTALTTCMLPHRSPSATALLLRF